MIGEGTQSFQIMNPELLICTLDSSAKLDIELTIGKGRGYVPAEDNKPKDASLVIFLLILFTLQSRM